MNLSNSTLDLIERLRGSGKSFCIALLNKRCEKPLYASSRPMRAASAASRTMVHISVITPAFGRIAVLTYR